MSENNIETTEKSRWKLTVNVYGNPTIFKRYANTEDEVKSLMLDQLKDYYDENSYNILAVEKDKTKTI